MVTGTTIDGQSFETGYDKLLIATGAAPILPDIPGIEKKGVMVLKTLADGRRIKEYLNNQSVKRVIIIGMGYIALEMCEALRALGLEVTMIKPNPQLLPWLDKELATVVETEITANGAVLRSGHQIKEIGHDGDHLSVACDEFTLDTDMVLVAIGVTPRSEIASGAGIELGPKNAIAVDRQLKTSDAHIFAAGDCADAYHVVTGQKTWIPLALRANRAGWAVADNVCGRPVELQGVAGTAVFKVFNLQVARTGLNHNEAITAGFDPAEVTIKSRSRAHAHPDASVIHVSMIGDIKTGRLLGVQMVGKEGVAHRINAPAVALHASMTVEQFGQSDLSYAPPFGPTWDPCLTAANQLLKKI
jgi:NADPH-dependent 2,4-dienoyl-CoA reductase/sulfur reductase-like enzyme